MPRLMYGVTYPEQPSVSVGTDTMAKGTIDQQNNYTTQPKSEANKSQTNGLVSLGSSAGAGTAIPTQKVSVTQPRVIAVPGDPASD